MTLTAVVGRQLTQWPYCSEETKQKTISNDKNENLCKSTTYETSTTWRNG